SGKGNGPMEGAKDAKPQEGVQNAGQATGAQRGGPESRGPAMTPTCSAFSTDGKRIAVGFLRSGPYEGPLLKIWAVATRKEAKYWRAPPAPQKDIPTIPWEREYHGVHLVAWLEGGKEILTVEDDNMCRIWKGEE